MPNGPKRLTFEDNWRAGPPLIVTDVERDRWQVFNKRIVHKQRLEPHNSSSYTEPEGEIRHCAMADVPTLLEHKLDDPARMQELKEQQDRKSNESNPNNDAFWTDRGLTRPADLDEAIKLGQEILHKEKGHPGYPVTGAGVLYNKAHHEKKLPPQRY